MKLHNLSRRAVLRGTAAGLVAGALPRGAFAKDVVVGLVYVGPRDDFGWNQAHAVAAKALKAVPGVTVVEEENVPETDRRLQNHGVDDQSRRRQSDLRDLLRLLRPVRASTWPRNIPTSSSATPRRCGTKDKDPMNAGSYFGYLNQAHYVDGVAAGLSTKSNKIGFVAAKPIPSVLCNINSLLLGARKTNPKATVQVIFTGEWSLPVREAEATNALVDAGCDVITCHVDSPKVVIETAERPRRQDLRPQCPPGPARAEGLHHRRRVQVGDHLQGLRRRTSPRARRCRTSSSAATTRTWCRTRPTVPARRPRRSRPPRSPPSPTLKADKPIYVGPLKDNTGKVVIDKAYDNNDPYLDGMNYLLEGVVGSIT